MSKHASTREVCPEIRSRVERCENEAVLRNVWRPRAGIMEAAEVSWDKAQRVQDLPMSTPFGG